MYKIFITTIFSIFNSLFLFAQQKEKHLKEFDSFTLIEINNSSGFEYNCMSNLIDINFQKHYKVYNQLNKI